MESFLPTRNLLKYSCRCAIGVAGIVLITGSTIESSLPVVFFRAATTFLLFLASCLANIFFLLCWEKKGRVVEPEFNLRRFLSGYLATFIVLVLLHQTNMSLIEKGVLPASFYDRHEFYPAESWLYWVHMLVVTFVVFILVYYFHNFILLLFAKGRTEQEISKLKMANFESANQLLRQQIQPHFLFNALNVLKSLIRKYPETAEAYLIRLSDFLRASLNVSKVDTATVREELKLCEDYMEMQKIRFGDSLHYHVTLEENDRRLDDYLPFFSLQSLLENAIKHNQLTPAAPLRIEVSRLDEWIEVKNNLQPKNFVEGSTGNGLFNLKERYRILSGDEVGIRMTEDEFSVRIKILNHEYRRNRG